MASEITPLQHHHLDLSFYSGVPIVGSIPALLKAAAGLVETVVSTIFVIILIIPSLFSASAASKLKDSGLHILSGTKRIFVGFILAIPGVGTSAFCTAHYAQTDRNGNLRTGPRTPTSSIFGPETNPLTLAILG